MQIVDSLSTARWCHSNCISPSINTQCYFRWSLFWLWIMLLTSSKHKLSTCELLRQQRGRRRIRRKRGCFSDFCPIEAGVTSAGKWADSLGIPCCCVLPVWERPFQKPRLDFQRMSAQSEQGRKQRECIKIYNNVFILKWPALAMTQLK